MTTVRQPRKLPKVLSLGEITRLPDAEINPRNKAAIAAAYGARLRLRLTLSLLRHLWMATNPI